jgi:transposase-like protein
MLYAVYMYFQGLSLRAVSACLEDLCPRSHVSVWRWVQRFSHLNELFTVGRVRFFSVDETWIKVGSQEAWLWLAFEPYGKFFLGFYLSRTCNILTAELFLQGLIDSMAVIPSTRMEPTGTRTPVEASAWSIISTIT